MGKSRTLPISCLLLTAFFASPATPQGSIGIPQCPPPSDCGGPFSANCPPNAASGFFTRSTPWWQSSPGWKWERYEFRVSDFLNLAAAVQNPTSPVKPNAQGNLAISIASGDLIGNHVVPRSQGFAIRESDWLNGVLASAPTTAPCLPSMLPIQAFSQAPMPMAPCVPLAFPPPNAVPGNNGGYRLLDTVFQNLGTACIPTKVILEFDYACLDGIVTQLLGGSSVAPNTALLEVWFETCHWGYAIGSYLGPGDTVGL